MNVPIYMSLKKYDDYRSSRKVAPFLLKKFQKVLDILKKE